MNVKNIYFQIIRPSTFISKTVQNLDQLFKMSFLDCLAITKAIYKLLEHYQSLFLNFKKQIFIALESLVESKYEIKKRCKKQKYFKYPIFGPIQLHVSN